jgi:hypothetical protein
MTMAGANAAIARWVPARQKQSATKHMEAVTTIVMVKPKLR